MSQGKHYNSQRRRLLAHFDNLSPKAREGLLDSIEKISPGADISQLQGLTEDGLRILEEWTDESGCVFQVIEADDGLSPEQRLNEITGIMADIALRVTAKQSQSECLGREQGMDDAEPQ